MGRTLQCSSSLRDLSKTPVEERKALLCFVVFRAILAFFSSSLTSAVDVWTRTKVAFPTYAPRKSDHADPAEILKDAKIRVQSAANNDFVVKEDHRHQGLIFDSPFRCVVCLLTTATRCILPCGHVVFCKKCARNIYEMQQQPTCLLCARKGHTIELASAEKIAVADNRVGLPFSLWRTCEIEMACGGGGRDCSVRLLNDPDDYIFFVMFCELVLVSDIIKLSEDTDDANAVMLAIAQESPTLFWNLVVYATRAAANPPMPFLEIPSKILDWGSGRPTESAQRRRMQESEKAAAEEEEAQRAAAAAIDGVSGGGAGGGSPSRRRVRRRQEN